MSEIKGIGLQNELAKIFKEYTTEIEKGLVSAKRKATKEAVSDLKAGSPKDRGRYAKNWVVTENKNGSVIHNKDTYSLTHLLENGHVGRDGGRVEAVVHIKPVEKKTVERFTTLIEEVIKK